MSGLTSELARRDNAKARVLAALVAAGPAGMANHELSAICLRFGARIKELRDEGHCIPPPTCVAGGCYRYVYQGPPAALPMPGTFEPPVCMPVYHPSTPQRQPKPGEHGGLF